MKKTTKTMMSLALACSLIAGGNVPFMNYDINNCNVSIVANAAEPTTIHANKSKTILTTTNTGRNVSFSLYAVGYNSVQTITIAYYNRNGRYEGSYTKRYNQYSPNKRYTFWLGSDHYKYTVKVTSSKNTTVWNQSW